MSTIPDNPFDATKPETQPAIPTTADQRLQHSNGNAAFAAAKNDVTALEATAPTADQKAALDAAPTAANAGNAYITRADAPAAGNAAYIDIANAWSVFQQFPANTNFLDAAYVQGASPTWSLIDTDIPSAEEVQATFSYNTKAYTLRARNSVGATLRVPWSVSTEAGVSGGVQVGAPTGGFQGENTLNAGDLLVNGQSVYHPNNPPPTFTTSTPGYAPASGGGTVNFLRADGAWVDPGGGGMLDIDQHSMYARLSVGNGPGEEMVINNLVNVTSPAGSESVLVMLSTGELRRILVSNFPTGGGGEVNVSTTPATVGGNEADINMPKVGSDLQKRKLSGTVPITIAQTSDTITFSAPDAARLSLDNVFTGATQRIDNSAIVHYELFQTGVVNQAGRWRMGGQNGAYVVEALNDAGATVAASPQFGIGHANFVGGTGVILGAAAFSGHGTLNAENGVFKAGTEYTIGVQTAKGQLIGHDGSTPAVIGAPANNQLLIGDTSESTGWKLDTAQALSPTQANGDLIVRQGAVDINLPIGNVGEYLRAKDANSLEYGNDNLLLTDAARTLGATVGVAPTARTRTADNTTDTPDPLTGAWVDVPAGASNALTIGLVANQGSVKYGVANGVTITLNAGYGTPTNDDPGGARHLVVSRVGSVYRATWV